MAGATSVKHKDGNQAQINPFTHAVAACCRAPVLSQSVLSALEIHKSRITNDSSHSMPRLETDSCRLSITESRIVHRVNPNNLFHDCDCDCDSDCDCEPRITDHESSGEFHVGLSFAPSPQRASLLTSSSPSSTIPPSTLSFFYHHPQSALELAAR